MTTYTTPQFATGPAERTVRNESALNRTRPAPAAPYRTAGVSDEAALMAAVHTQEWQPGAAKKGVPKAAIGALGVALIGGAALAIVLLSPADKVTKQVMPDPIAQATAQNTAAQKSVDSTDAAVKQMDENAPAAGNAATPDASSTQQQATAPAADAAPAPVQSATPAAPPVVNAPVARVHHAPAPAPRVAPQPTQQSAPVVTPDAPAPAQSVTPPADVQPPAMQQTPDAPTVTPAPTPAPTPDTPAPTPAPAPTE